MTIRNFKLCFSVLFVGNDKLSTNQNILEHVQLLILLRNNYIFETKEREEKKISCLTIRFMSVYIHFHLTIQEKE